MFLPFLPKAVLFDHDGVLVSSEPLHWRAWGLLLGELGIPYHESELQALVGKTSPEIITRLLDAHAPDWRRPDGKSPRHDITELTQRKNEHYLSALQGGLPAYPGVAEGIRWLKSRGVGIAVVSNARRRELEAGLHSAGLHPLIDEILARDDLAHHKPHPLPYLTAAARLGADPADCLAVEDSPPGIESALVGGIPAAAVLTNFAAEAFRSPVPGRPDLKPVWVGPSMEALFEALRALPRRS